MLYVIMKKFSCVYRDCLLLYNIRRMATYSQSLSLRKEVFCSSCGLKMRTPFLYPFFVKLKATRLQNFSSYIEDDFTLVDDDDVEKIKKVKTTNLDEENVFLIQPVEDTPINPTTPDLELAESVALVESLPKWKVIGKFVDSKESKYPLFFHEKTVNDIAVKLRTLPSVSCVFVSVEQLLPDQRAAFRKLFGVDKIYDRYTLVLQIFKLRAQTKAAKLQVALAEISYARNHLVHGITSGETPQRQKQGYVAESYQNQLKNLFHQKEKKLRKELEKLAKNRDLHRHGRERLSVPIVAVVGYTNAGKTSLIKALAKAEKMEPKDQLFATLDVTAHAAFFPNKLRYVLIDTVGFLSNLPLDLFDAFAATMEDMLCADVIVHVRDESHPDRSNQLKNVLAILSNLKLKPKLMKNIVEVRNKIDVVNDSSSDGKLPSVVWPKMKQISLKSGQRDLRPAVVCRVSATRGTGLEDLVEVLEEVVMTITGRKRVEMLVPAAGEHVNWLRENACIEELTGEGDFKFRLTVIVTEAQYEKFIHNFEDVEILRHYSEV